MTINTATALKSSDRAIVDRYSDCSKTEVKKSSTVNSQRDKANLALERRELYTGEQAKAMVFKATGFG